MKTLVTGGAGFIGSNLADRLLADGHEVRVVDDLSTGKESNLTGALETGRCELVKMSVTDKSFADLVDGIDVVYHLAAQADVRISVADPVFDVDVNVLGSVNVFEAAANAGVGRVVFASSGGTIYGEPAVLPVDESAPQRPLSPYGVAKKAAGDYLYYYQQVRGIDGVVLALANIYGPRQDPHGEAGVVSIFAGVINEGKAPVIYGDGSQTRDFVFIDDVVDAFVLAAERGDGLMNIGTGEETSVNELYYEIAKAMGSDAKPEYGPARTGELSHIALDASLAERELGWAPKTGLPSGLAKTIDWIRS
ncbi:MAG: UDP-glucose 4-epimerase [Acidobacteria bacterium]|nr:MAG: UDP-glucose 4-epimerase [Acidobacteriota bacterium]